jgi:uncharacterized protein YdhG (YjbR/CyaY superfamily)
MCRQRPRLTDVMIKKAPAKSAKAGPGGADLAAVEAYLAKVPEPARGTLESVRAAIRSAVPAAATEVIGYGMPAFRYEGVLVSYAAFKDHCSFFPMSAVLLDEFAEDVNGYRTSKGTLQFPLDKPLPKALVRNIVRIRVMQNEGKALKRKAAKGAR